MGRIHLGKGTLVAISTLSFCAAGVLVAPIYASTAGVGENPAPVWLNEPLSLSQLEGENTRIRFTASGLENDDTHTMTYAGGQIHPDKHRSDTFSDYVQIEYSIGDEEHWKDFAEYKNDSDIYFSYFADKNNEENDYVYQYDQTTTQAKPAQKMYVRLKTLPTRGSVYINGPKIPGGNTVMHVGDVFELNPVAQDYFSIFYLAIQPVAEISTDSKNFNGILKISDPNRTLNYSQVELVAKDVKPDKSSASSFASFMKDGDLIGYFSLDFYGVKADGTKEQITELDKDITVTLGFSKDFFDVSKYAGYDVKDQGIYVVRKHTDGNDKVSYDKIAATAQVGDNTISFKTNKFSDWAIGVDGANNSDNADEGVDPADTYDGISSYFILGGVSLIGLVGGTVFAIYTRKQMKKD